MRNAGHGWDAQFLTRTDYILLVESIRPQDAVHPDVEPRADVPGGVVGLNDVRQDFGGRRDCRGGGVQGGGEGWTQQAVTGFDQRHTRPEKEASLHRQVRRIGSDQSLETIRWTAEATRADNPQDHQCNKPVDDQSPGRQSSKEVPNCSVGFGCPGGASPRPCILHVGPWPDWLRLRTPEGQTCQHASATRRLPRR
ncbi:MAG: hypothetical protein EBV53_14440 [Proteobacteria bacterium]|nr:hypothetical protein [Pseudomonadota bacterium]